MSIQLRDYQEKLVGDVRSEVLAGRRSILIQLPTAGGKTAIAADILKRSVAKGAHTWFVCHRREIISQSVLAMDKAGVECGIIAASFPERPAAPVQVCSIQSLPRRMPRLKLPNLIIVDEAHHVAAASWSKVIEAYPNAIILGLSATPKRLSGEGLGKWFQSMVRGPSITELTEKGWLSPYRLFTPSKVDLSSLHLLGGEYNQHEVDVKMKAAQVSGDAIVHYKRTVPGKRALCFAWSIEASIELAGRFNAEGIPAAHVDGTTPSLLRDSIVRDFVAGKIKVITNVDVFSEGVDLPAIEALFMLRPTASLARYLQMVGRALRTHPGKECCWIFDHANNASSGGHGFPDDEREWSLDGKKKKKKQESEGPLCRTCPNCFETHPIHVRICPCGYQLVMEREVEVDADAQLVEIDPAVARRQRLMEQGKADSLEKLIQLGKSKGYKYPDQWARFIFKAREEKKAAKERQLREREGLSPKQAEFYAGFSDLGALEAPDPWAF